MKRVLVVLNPSSSDFEAERRWPELRSALSAFGKIEVVETEPDDRTTHTKVAGAMQDGGHERVIAIGGDGTVHLVVNALREVGLERMHRLAVIPFGTANDVAKSLELPLRDLPRLAQIAMSDRFGSTTRRSMPASFAIKQADLLDLGVSELLEDLTDDQRTFRGRRIEPRFASPRTVQVDGEVFGTADEVECEVIAQLEVPVPD